MRGVWGMHRNSVVFLQHSQAFTPKVPKVPQSSQSS
jgi:hypothetical protein